MIFVLVPLILMCLSLIYVIQKDIVSPGFIFDAVFLAAAVNVMTNVGFYKVNLSFSAFCVVAFGVIFFSLGTLVTEITNNSYSKQYTKPIINKSDFGLKEISKPILIALIAFNVFSIVYILLEVYQLAIDRAGYEGELLSSLSAYAEASKFTDIDMKVSTVSTLLTALCEAEAYALGYFLARKIAYKVKINILEIICFLLAFFSTFCQGSRGGVFIIMASIIDYIVILREVRGSKKLPVGIIVKIILIGIFALVSFQIMGVVTGKMWDVPIYEYLSVYLGDPILNLDIVIHKGIDRTPFWGYLSFLPLIKSISSKLGLSLPSFDSGFEFQYINNRNTGNVYTIFYYLIADFGYLGYVIVLFALGMICQVIYKKTISTNEPISTIKVVYGYVATCIGFSFFSNKICENVTIYHGFLFFFVYFWIRILFYGGLKSSK